MSVKMALAQLCACACGGAAIGGGAVHYANRHPHVAHSPARRAVARTVTTTTCLPGSSVLSTPIRNP